MGGWRNEKKKEQRKKSWSRGVYKGDDDQLQWSKVSFSFKCTKTEAIEKKLIVVLMYTWLMSSKSLYRRLFIWIRYLFIYFQISPWEKKRKLICYVDNCGNSSSLSVKRAHSNTGLIYSINSSKLTFISYRCQFECRRQPYAVCMFAVCGFVSDVSILKSLTFSSMADKESRNQQIQYHNVLHQKKPVMRWHCSNLLGPASQVPKGNGRSDTIIHYGIMPCFKITSNLLKLKPSLLDECVWVYLFRPSFRSFPCNKITL